MNPTLRFPGTLRGRMGLAFTLLLLVAALVITVVGARHIASIQLQAQQRLGQSLLKLVQPILQQWVATGNRTAIADYLKAVGADPAIASLEIRAADGAALYDYHGIQEPPSLLTRLLTDLDDGHRQLVTPISHAGRRVGTLVVELSYRPLNQGIRHVVANGAWFAAVLLAVILAITYSLITRFTRPLRPLTQFAREVSRGNWSPQVQLITSRSREIQELNQAFVDGSTTMRHYIGSIEETRELLAYSENRLRKLVNGMHEILFDLDAHGRIAFLNPAWERLTGFTIDRALGNPLADFLVDYDAGSFDPRALAGLQRKNREIRLLTAAGGALWVSLEASLQFDTEGQFTGIIGTLADITDSVELNRLLRQYQDELYHMSVTDPLTGLYNRRHFDGQIENILADHLAQQQPVCLLLIDLDGFKFINDTYGHPFGDEVLRTTAGLLRTHVRRHDYLARLAGDEFAMVLKGTESEDATRIARKLHAKISETRIDLPVGHIQIRASIGVACAPTHGRNAQELISAADVALYHSKRGGRNRIEVLSPDTSKAMMSIFSQGFMLRNALQSGDIHPAFQPICSLESGKPMAYEVLARLRHRGTIIQAKDFITVAEELGLTREVDLHIIREALRAAPPEHALFLNVNLSSFSDRGFVHDLSQLIKPACEAGRSITIEITERETIPLTETLQRDIRYLRDIGCKLALDDFGSGYSTYNFLNQFRPDYIKIEGEFVRRMLSSEADRKIVEHIHELASAFDMETIAESVEDEATLLALKAIGIRNAQGHHLGHPTLDGTPA